MSKRFFDLLGELEQLLHHETPESLNRSRVESMLRDKTLRRYFFRNAGSQWLSVLVEEGQFDKALDQDVLAYLARIAPEAPSDVATVIRTLGQAKDEGIQQCLALAAARIVEKCPQQVDEHVRHAASWLTREAHISTSTAETLLELALEASHHCSEGASLSLVREMLEVRPAETPSPAVSSLDTRIDLWTYRRTLVRLVEEYAKDRRLGLLEALCALLERICGVLSSGNAAPLVAIWRPTIEDSDANDPSSLVSSVVAAVRGLAEAVVSSDADAVLRVLAAHSDSTFRRLELHVHRICPDLGSTAVARLVTDKHLVSNENLRHELLMLVRDSFGSLPAEARERYIQLVQELDEQVQTVEYLAPVLEYLPDEVASAYPELASVSGEAWRDTVERPLLEWIGPTSPYSAEQMAAWDIPELVRKLNAWEYTRGWRLPEPEGLARELAAFASQNAERVSKQATAFEKLQQPTCVRGIVQGLADAVKEGRAISWEPVLHLCKWSVEQERGDEPEGTGLEEFDCTWEGARKQIAWLLTHGTEKSEAEIPPEFENDVLSILRVLVEDSDPTEEKERSSAEYMDPLTLAINTVRGVALGATFFSALWVARHDPQEVRTWDRFGLSDVRKSLEERLAEDQSPAVRSLFGKWLPYLFWLDQKWTESNVKSILPLDEVHVWTAVWDAYLMFCSTLYSEFLELLRPSYERALDVLGTVQPKQTRPANPDERLGNHLLLFYRVEALKLHDALLKGFFEKADANLRYSVMAGAVRQIQDVSEDRREEVVERLTALWEWRSRETLGEMAEEHHELSSFGWWFLKDVFPPEWRLRQLLVTQQNNIELQLDGRVLEKMIELSEDRLPLVLDCLEAIVRNPAGGEWGIYDDHVKEILRIALGSGDRALLDQAENLVHYIGSLGFLSFRDLLTPNQTHSDPREEGDT